MISCIINTLSDRLTFGQYKGFSFADVLDINPDYIIWVMENADNVLFVITDQAKREVQEAYPNFIFSADLDRIRKAQSLPPYHFEQ